MAQPNSLTGIGEKIQDAATTANENIQAAVSNVGESFGAVKDSINNTLSDFSSKSSVAVNDSSFLDSNSIIAKFAFLLLVLFGFVMLLYLGVALIGYFTSNPNPVLIPGQIIGTIAQPPVTQNPTLATSLPILWSNNQNTGLEYTWSVWLQYQPSSIPNIYQPVFIKGDCSNPNTPITNPGAGVLNRTQIAQTSAGMAPSYSQPTFSLNNGPGLYFVNDSTTANLYLLIDTINSSTPTAITIPNIPIDKYFHLAIRCQNIYIDIYINGTVVTRTQLPNVPKQNFYNVFVCPAGGFGGFLSTLQYYSRALSVVDINAIASGKPNTSMLSNSNTNISNSNFLSTSWYNSFV
uniref:LamG-like jellyroll fold domain-containing protein n=1 Tax=viral metagenome TaxID=1070528 RepID=A0A6C0HYZ0_9ZZZZ